MSENIQTSETTPDGAEISAPEPTADETLGDPGKRALAALRSENKELKAKLKAQEADASDTRDAVEGESNPSDSARDAATDATPNKPRFLGTADQGSRGAPELHPQLTRADLESMSSFQINMALSRGQLRNLLSGA